jgi:hypothetical protein
VNKKSGEAPTGLSAIELMRIVSLEEAARLTGLHRATLRANHPDKILRLSKNRVGMRLRDVFAIGDRNKDD